MKKTIIIALSILCLLLTGCTESRNHYTEDQDESLSYEEIYEKAYENGFEDGKSKGYDEAMSEASKCIDNYVYEAAYSAGNYEDLLGIIQTYLDGEDDFTYEEVQEAISRLYFEFESLDHYCSQVRETKDPWQSSKQWNWNEQYPGSPWDD